MTHDTHRSMDLTTALRAFLRDRREHAHVKAAALAYELAALIGRDSVNAAFANATVEAIAAQMKDQIRTFGVGAEHP